MAPAAAQAPEVQFAQRLAANEKRIRDRAVKKLRGYISLRTQRPGGGFSQEELLKIWKGLFYCMWMQDKPLLQEELANNISQLIHVIQNTEAQHLFIRTFWQTMSREWNGIDNLRLDKYYMLIRMILRQCFEVLKRNDWDESLRELLLQLLMKEVMDPDSNAPKGIKFHFIDIYLQELAKVGAKELTADQSLKFIEPFCNFVAKSKDPSVMHAVASGIFEIIVDQSPYAIEDLMKELESSSDEEDVSEDDEQGKKEMLKTKASRRLSGKSAQSAEKTEDVYENADDSIGPVLQFDYKAVADKLFELASKKNTPSLNRKHLYKLVKKFQDLAEGSGKDEQETSSAKETSVPQKRRKKRKMRKSPHADSGTTDGNSEEGIAETSGSVLLNPGKMPENSKMKKKKKLLVNETNDIRNAVSDTRDKHSVSAQSSQTDTEQSKKIQSEKMNPKVQNVLGKLECQNGPANANKAEDVNTSVTPLIPKESSTAVSLLKKKKAKQGSDFVKFEKSTVPRALLFRKARSTISSTRASIPSNKLQSSGSKKVTFGLNKNMTAEFKKTDKSILVSPEGPSRVAFNPAQKPRHGVLKSPAGTPDGEPKLKKPLTAQAKKKTTARGFF
ncbi:hypothetical protein CIB84_001165 [Bambusicola thoracicus]|uniref:RRP1B protein n=1 Tax=Bambusicola thoracicus TaxID=9083 RepID=A0A2P4TFE2_BAMTH|nr:hypothetical protein CIB84_001165 [Bambusicola thoracicus]